MLIKTILPYLLLLFKPSGAEFGFQVAIPNLRSSIETTIGDGLQPLNQILRESKLLTQSHEVLFKTPKYLLFAMTNTSQVVEEVLSNVTSALEDANSGPSKTFTALNASINFAKVQVAVIRAKLPDFVTPFLGTDRMKAMNDSWNDLVNGLNVLTRSLSSLNDSLSTAQRSVTITLSNIGSLVTPKQIDDVIDGLQMVSESMNKMRKIALTLLNLFELVATDKEDAFERVRKVFNFTRTERSVNATIMETINSVRKMSQSFNTTILSSYQPLTKIKLINNSDSIAAFATKLGSAMTAINSTEATFTNVLQRNVLFILSSYVDYIRILVSYNLDAVLPRMMKNETLTEKCIHRHPLVNDSLNMVAQLVDSCVHQQMTYLPSVVSFIRELVELIRGMLLSPIRDLQACTSRLSQKLCLPGFANTTLSASKSANINSLLSLVESHINEVGPLTRNEVERVYQRIDSCALMQFPYAMLENLKIARWACLDG